ncbi:MAG TPA: nitronate monooxygenase [Gemmatimonadaceae bacterium]|nr:nitronate monooxygenase [Gemmatimonadaceae bacterium]
MSVLPRIIQGGMGVAVSNWRLANAVSRAGQLGVVSGTVLDTVMVRRLQDGDPEGHIRRAMAHFPIAGIADAILRRYFLESGRGGAPYKALPMYKQVVTDARQQVTMVANFVEVWLAKEGHNGPVGLNLLTKVQMPNLASLYGAMLAGVDYVIMGAGIPREIPGALDAIAAHQPAQLRLDVEGGAKDDVVMLTFDPRAHWEGEPPAPLARPKFIAVVSANSLATTLARKSTGRVDGFVVEGPTAGGHNAPPRGALQLTSAGEPVYGERDEVDLAKMRELGLPFWLAGGMGSPDALKRALDAGAAGIQVGTLFALCEESGIEPGIRSRLVSRAIAGSARVFTDPHASPTGYPFKTVALDEPAVPRKRVCDLGYLRVASRDVNGRLVYRCPAEPVADYVRKGGKAEDAEGRRCLCNGLTATVGLGQLRAEGVEEPIITSGDDLATLGPLLGNWGEVRAANVVRYLTAESAALPNRP